MRTPALAVAALAASLALPGAALAQNDDSFLLWEQSSKPNTSTGFDIGITLSEADSQKQLTGMVVKFPPGSRIDADGAPLCTASREERIEKGHEAVCPAETRIGTGEASAVFQSGPITADLEFWNVRAVNDRDVLNAEQVVNGQKAGYFSGTLGANSITFAFNSKLISFNGTVRKSTRTVDGQKVAYLRTPPTCGKKKRWKVRTKLLFEDKTTKTLYAYPPCGSAG